MQLKEVEVRGVVVVHPERLDEVIRVETVTDCASGKVFVDSQLLLMSARGQQETER